MNSYANHSKLKSIGNKELRFGWESKARGNLVSRLRFPDVSEVYFLNLIPGVNEFAVGFELFSCGVVAAADVGGVEAGY